MARGFLFSQPKEFRKLGPPYWDTRFARRDALCAAACRSSVPVSLPSPAAWDCSGAAFRFCTEPRLRWLMQSFCPNKSLHFRSVENPPVKTVQLLFQQRPCFLGFSSARASMRFLCGAPWFVGDRWRWLFSLVRSFHPEGLYNDGWPSASSRLLTAKTWLSWRGKIFRRKQPPLYLSSR